MNKYLLIVAAIATIQIPIICQEEDISYNPQLGTQNEPADICTIMQKHSKVAEDLLTIQHMFIYELSVLQNIFEKIKTEFEGISHARAKAAEKELYDEIERLSSYIESIQYVLDRYLS
ncbi:MAG TPA: hypothetical protein VGW78_00865 [Candidatus Babeliales bacterium]|jgi:hypothetical protein|nr:hypothetical protein [Candidatus Babeliales bacterium]